MNTQEVTVLLARIQVLDNRQVDELTIQAWEPLVEDIEYVDAVQAVNEHYRGSDRYLMPKHIVEAAHRAKALRTAASTRGRHVHKFDRHGYCACSAQGEPSEE